MSAQADGALPVSIDGILARCFKDGFKLFSTRECGFMVDSPCVVMSTYDTDKTLHLSPLAPTVDMPRQDRWYCFHTRLGQWFYDVDVLLHSQIWEIMLQVASNVMLTRAWIYISYANGTQ